MTERTALYRLYDADGRLLYLGITVNVNERFPQHTMTKFWWHLVTRKTIKWHPSREEAEEAERTATVAERPIYDASYRAGNGVKYKDDPPIRDPYWRELAETIYREIESGHYAPGEALPSEKPLAAKYGLSSSSAGQAIERLIQCRMIERPSARNYYKYIVRLPADRLPIEAIQEPTPGELWERKKNG